ncbi:MAG TPA: hypothetical protein VIT23_17195, partial [Terrimicrobiaceae bacterium]
GCAMKTLFGKDFCRSLQYALKFFIVVTGGGFESVGHGWRAIFANHPEGVNFPSPEVILLSIVL